MGCLGYVFVTMKVTRFAAFGLRSDFVTKSKDVTGATRNCDKVPDRSARKNMVSNSRNQKKKPYSPPTLIKLTPEQAKKLVVDRNSCTDEEAADLLKLFPNKHNEE